MIDDMWERVFVVAIGGFTTRDDYELPALVKRAARIADLAEDEYHARVRGVAPGEVYISESR